MDDLTRRFRSIDWKGIQRQARKMQASTASALKDLVMTDLENKVRAATADTNWGASGADLTEIAQGTYNREDYNLIMSIIWQRLGSTRWRCVYKALDVLKFVVLHGVSRVHEETRSALHHIRALEHYHYIDPVTRRDEGENVRARATAFVALLQDDALLEEEREKSKKLRAKIGVGALGPSGASGLSSDDFRYGSAGSGSYTGGLAGGGGYSPDAPSPPTHTSTAGGYGAYGGNERSSFGGYDDEPTGAYGRRKETSPQSNRNSTNSAVNQSVDDLLGGDSAPPAAVATTKVSSTTAPSFDVDDDEDFNPRAKSSGTGNTAPSKPDLTGSLLADVYAQSPSAKTVGNSANGTSQNVSIPTSQLVANLAAATKVPTPTATPNYMEAAKREEEEKASAQGQQKDVAFGGLVHFDNIMLDKNSRVEVKKPIREETGGSVASPVKPGPAPVPAPTKTEVDPFGDLLSTAKKTGVL